MNRLMHFLAAALLSGLLVAKAIAAASDLTWTFGGDAQVGQADSHIDATLQPGQEKFYVHLPANYDGKEPFGLIVFTDSEDAVNLPPPGWGRVLEKEKLLFVAAQNAGNDQSNNRRLGLALMAVKGMEDNYKIDTNRIYAAGYSGGARISSELGFYASDVFKGTIQSCGTNFYHAVPKVLATPQAGDAGNPYGLLDADQTEVDSAKKNVRFVLITGSNDFRRGNIRDIYDGGFEKENFQALLIDVPGMSHDVCPPRALSAAIDYIEGRAPSTQPAVAPPAWMARDPSDWPQILLTNDIRFSDGSTSYGASAFLMRLPNGVIVGATAKHVVGIDNLADVKSRLALWAVLRPNSHSAEDRIGLTQFAEKIPGANSSDWFVMLCPSQEGPWPGEPLPVASDPVEVGDTVYVLAVPDGDQSRQNVYKGLVTQADGSGQFFYSVAQAPNSHGFSGAPILDAEGRITGFHSGHSDKAGVYYGYDTASLLPLIQLPAGFTAPALRETVGATNAPTAGGAAPPAPSPQSEADAMVRSAQLLIDNGVYDKARVKLESVIKAFPNTPAAEMAQKMIDNLPSQ
jgi:hypothetical protein